LREVTLGFLNDFSSIFTRYHTWALMANQDITMRYRRSVIGPFWISIAMAVTILAIGLLFSEVQNQPFKEYLSFFGCGLLAWTLLLSFITEGAGIVPESEGHLRNIALPIPVLSAKVVYRNLIIFGHNALVVGLMLALLGQPIEPVALVSLLALMVYISLGLFIGIALAPICARFRDLPQVIGSAMQVMFFLTPIFWIPGANMDRHVVLEANPFYHLLEIFRRPLLGSLPTELNWIVSLSALALSAIAAVIVLGTTRKRIYLWL
jgi:ABC-type polysaccharide/polyol phosphate export permease